MTREAHVLGIIRTSRTEEEAKQRLQEFLEPDYIPKNPVQGCPMASYGRDDIVNIRPAWPGSRCAGVVGHDLQSGPLYCGQPAYLYGDSKSNPDVFYVMCQTHARRHGLSL